MPNSPDYSRRVDELLLQIKGDCHRQKVMKDLWKAASDNQKRQQEQERSLAS